MGGGELSGAGSEGMGSPNRSRSPPAARGTAGGAAASEAAEARPAGKCRPQSALSAGGYRGPCCRRANPGSGLFHDAAGGSPRIPPCAPALGSGA